MIPTGLTADDDKYDEYMVIDGVIERVGSWEIDLSGYIKAEEGKRLITDAEADKLENLLTINSVSSDFTVSADNQLSLNNLSVSKISDLATWLNDNAGTQKGLSENNLTNDLYSKLNNSLFISGVNTEQLSVDTSGVLSVLSINQNQVKGLADILNSKANTTQVTNLETQLNDMKDKVDEIEGRLMWQEIN